jgi:predicted aspartyl protease
MIVGTVTDEGVPTVALTVAGRTWLATIDTGFNGDLELPAGLQPFVNARFFARARSFLAAGQSVEEDTYIVDFPFDGSIVTVLSTFVLGQEVLIGTGLLRQYRLEINFVERTVLLERIVK